MKHADFDKLFKDTIAEMEQLLRIKGGEYAGDIDRLANFKRNAERLQVHPLTIWAVYFYKHIDAINQFVQDIQAGKTRQRSESIFGRFDDALNYLMLGKALVMDCQETPVTLKEFILEERPNGFYMSKKDPTKGEWEPCTYSFIRHGDYLSCKFAHEAAKLATEGYTYFMNKSGDIVEFWMMDAFSYTFRKLP